MHIRRSALSYVIALTAVVACGDSTPKPIVATAPTASATSSKELTAMPTITLADAGIVPEWMDPAANPCQDYFAYACGGFVKDATIPADRADWGATPALQKSNEDFLRTTLESAAAAAAAASPNVASDQDVPAKKKIGDYYASCIDEAAIEKAGVGPIAPLLAIASGAKDASSLANAITKLHANGVFMLFDLTSQQDFKDATRMIAGLDQSGIGLPDRDYYLKDEGNMKDVREFYAAHVARMLALVASKGVLPAPITLAQTAAAADVMRIETKIAKLEQDKVTRRDPYATYHRVDRAGLPKVATHFPWDAYFTTLGIPKVQEISINDEGYFKGIDALLSEEKPAAWRNYLAWRVVRSNASILTKAFIDETFALKQKLTGQKEVEPRWKRCVRGVDNSLGELLAQPYVTAKFAGDSKARAQELTDLIRAAMRSDLQSLPWMDEATRAASLQKIDKMGSKVGYPDHWRAYDFAITRTSYAANALAADHFEQHRQLAKIGKPVDRSEWDMTPPTVNAYYNSSMNEIVLPAGALQPPFFSRTFYTPVNVGDMGANWIGHETTHGFDDEGSQFDGDGNLRDFWTKETKAKFEAATQCVKDQFSGYDAIPGVKLNGGLTAGENIADIGGIKLGLVALSTWQSKHPSDRRHVEGPAPAKASFSDEQLFFLGYAQGWCSKETPELLEMLARSNPHSPPRWRVNGPMADTPTFATAYQCAPATPMTPSKDKVCAVW